VPPVNVVFLHGVVGSSATYDWLPERITAGRTVLRPDFRGHGAAPWTPGQYRLSDYGGDIVELLRGLDGPAALVGHSLGGATAWWVAQHHPSLVTGIFLEDPPLFQGTPEAHANNRALDDFRVLRELIVRWQADGTTIEQAAEQIAAAPYDQQRSQGEVLTEEAIQGRAYSLLHCDPGVVDGVLEPITLAEADPTARITVPVTILAAGVRPAFQPEHEQTLARTHPDIRCLRIATAGHCIHHERAHRDEYVERVAEFLSAVEQRQQ
jgi:esterase